VPAAESFEALNARLEAACLADLDRKASGQSETIGSRWHAPSKPLMQVENFG
jgi:hypothetical protein